MTAPGPATAELREEVLEHLWQRFPQHCLVLTDARTRRFVDLAIERAASRGFYSRNEVVSYTNVMVYLGSFFDEDPQWAWAGESLGASSLLPAPRRMAQLYARMNEVLQTVAGDQGEFYRRALLAAGSQPFEWFVEDGSGSPEERIRRWLKKSYIRKDASLTDEALSQICERAKALAEQHGLDSGSGQMLLCELMLLLGWGVDRDPLHPWVAVALGEASPDDPLAGSRRLYDCSMFELQRYLKLDRTTRKG